MPASPTERNESPLLQTEEQINAEAEMEAYDRRPPWNKLGHKPMEFTDQTQEERLHDVPGKLMRDSIDQAGLDADSAHDRRPRPVDPIDQAMAEKVTEVYRVAALPSVEEAFRYIHLRTFDSLTNMRGDIQVLAEQGLEALERRENYTQ